LKVKPIQCKLYIYFRLFVKVNAKKGYSVLWIFDVEKQKRELYLKKSKCL